MGERADWTGVADRRIVGAEQTRRSWLRAGALTVLSGLASTVRAQPPRKEAPSPDDERAIVFVRNKATKAGLKDLDTRRTENFLGVGDAPARYRDQALDLCENIGQDYLAHFRRLGFKLDYPASRMTVVPLKDGASYRAFSGDDPRKTIGGQYEPEPNWLVIFDFRADQAKSKAEAMRYNTFALVHETVHLLCFNTGLLSRFNDVPGCISEGLATYGEVWTPPHAPNAFGKVNVPRIRGMIQAGEDGTPWIPIARLLNDDKIFDDPKLDQLAYAESWLLVHYLLVTKEQLPKFQDYLAGMPELGDAGRMSRDKYAESKLGSLRDLDVAVQRHAQAMARRARLKLPPGLIRARG
jgi:hypothetical protein